MDIENNKEAVNGGDRIDNDIKSRIFPGPRKGGGRLKREIGGTERVLPEAADMRLGTVPDSLELFSILSDRG